MSDPVLSIVMPVYNREQYLKKTIESILNQTFTDFEFVIIDDGSTDKSTDIIQSYNDERIILLKNSKNRGIPYTRNKGLEIARGKYIGMFDSDDIAFPDKFKEQIKFLEEYKDVGMVGALVKIIDKDGKPVNDKWRLKAKSKYIPSILLFHNYFAQPAVVIRKEAIPEGGYDETYIVAQDYKMWYDISMNYKVANLPKYLLACRRHPDNISKPSNKNKVNPILIKFYRQMFKKINIEMSEDEFETHLLIRNNKKIKTKKELEQIEQWLLKISQQNNINKFYPQIILQKVIFERWMKSCFKARNLHLITLKKILFSPLSRYFF